MRFSKVLQKGKRITLRSSAPLRKYASPNTEVSIYWKAAQLQHPIEKPVTGASICSCVTWNEAASLKWRMFYFLKKSYWPSDADKWAASESSWTSPLTLQPEISIQNPGGLRTAFWNDLDSFTSMWWAFPDSTPVCSNFWTSSLIGLSVVYLLSLRVASLEGEALLVIQTWAIAWAEVACGGGFLSAGCVPKVCLMQGHDRTCPSFMSKTNICLHLVLGRAGWHC